jgi:hypothetical protein
MKLNSHKQLVPHKVHLAPLPTHEDTTGEHRIVGGEEAAEGEFPFYVNWNEFGSFCGGSLIHEDIILTAAHCAVLSTDEILIGAYYLDSFVAGEETQTIETRRVHPEYDDFTMVNDVMVLKIASPSLLQPIALNDDSASPSSGEDVVAIGLGLTTEVGDPSDVLLKVSLPTVAHDECAALYADFGPIVEDVMLCAGLDEGGKDTCQGDSGGPLLELRDGGYVQVGITSWGNGCAQPNAPGVYTRVSGVKSWIDEMICELSSNPPESCGSTPATPATPTIPPATPTTPSSECEDVPGWYDADGPEYDCTWYAQYGNCELFGSGLENDGYTANEACCVCGGGKSESNPSETISPSSSFAPSGENNCEDVPGWHDLDGQEFDCTWYAQKSNCENYGSEFENDGFTANGACCVCGGGNTESTPLSLSSPETSSPTILLSTP